ncbi:MAG: LOG family protein [Candidatus Neomarinimicrobiota bacterium]
MTRTNKERFYYDKEFLSSTDARPLRIIAEYFGPRQRLNKYHVEDTIVFFGSARIKETAVTQAALDQAGADSSPEERNRLENDLKMSKYYEAARELACKLTNWSKNLKEDKRRFIITSGGGPGIMEAANRGASDAKGLTCGLNITIPFEQSGNSYITPDLNIQFHYFFMRKFWFLYLAKALVVFPGGFGTLDELTELVTLIQTKKMKKVIPIVLFGKEFWNNVINWDYLVETGTISAADLKLFQIYDSVDEACDYLTKNLASRHYKGVNF